MNPKTPTTAMKQGVVANGVWMMVNSVTSRATGLVGQLVLAWLLVREDFGLFALATSMAVVVDLVSQFGLSDVLVSRYRRFHLWQQAGYSISMILGVSATIAMLLIAVGGSIVYQNTDLGWMIAIMAIAAPIRAIGIVPYAQLRGEMRYRPIAIVQSLATVVSMAVAILLALLGFGVYSFAWSKVADSIVQTSCWIRITKTKFPRRFTLRGAKYLIADSLHGYTASFFFNLVQQSDYLILGLFVAEGELGGYFMAFMISVQAIGLIAMNLKEVLFSALSTLVDNPERQTRAFIRSLKMLAFVCVPVCCLQILVAEPLITLAFPSEWHSIVLLVQIMSLGTAFRCATFGWDTLLKAQKRFSTVAKYSAVAAIFFPCVIALGCYLGGVVGCAIGSAIYYGLGYPLQLYLVIRSEENAAKQVLDLCVRSLLIAGAAFGMASLLAMPARNAGMPILEIAIDTAAGIALYWGLSWIANPVPARDAWEAVRQIREKTMPRSQTRTNAT